MRAVLLGWQLGLAKLLMLLSLLGSTRQAQLPVATEHFTPNQLNIDTAVPTNGPIAVIVIIAWSIAALAIGAPRHGTPKSPE
jgi:hypothetical protein